MAQLDADLFKSLLDGEHSLRGFTNRDIRSQLTKTRWLRSCADDQKKASAKVGRCFRRLHAHGLDSQVCSERSAGASRPMAIRRWVRRCTCASTTSPTSTSLQQRSDLPRERQRINDKRIYPRQQLGDRACQLLRQTLWRFGTIGPGMGLRQGAAVAFAAGVSDFAKGRRTATTTWPVGSGRSPSASAAARGERRVPRSCGSSSPPVAGCC